MPRQVRIQYPGAMYHVMSRGDRREDIFLDDVDRQDFLKTLAEGCQKTAWQVHAYCLMRNHYHLVVETPNANLVAGMAWLQGSYTIRLNHWHPRDAGHISRSGASSAARSGSTIGTQEMLGRAEGQLGEHHFGALRQETAEAKAERIIGEELGRRGWREDDLAARRKSDAGKLEIAARVRRETTLTLKQIAERLHLGTPRSASVRLQMAAKEPTRRVPALGNLAI
jgi:REP element-mobilizing transposase RayT